MDRLWSWWQSTWTLYLLPLTTTSKLQLYYKTVTLEDHPATSWTDSYTWGYKEAWSGLVGEIERKNVLVPHWAVAVKNWEDCLGCRGPHCGARAPRPTTGSPASGINARKRSSYNSWPWKSGETQSVWDEGLLETQVSSFLKKILFIYF